MTRLSTGRRLAAAIAIAITATIATTGCGLVENVVGGVVGEAREQVDGMIGDALGGAGISTDGELPPGFPVDAIPVVGTVQGGGSSPESSGWVVLSTLSGVDQFVVAQQALEAAGFSSSAVNSDANGGFGTFTLTPYTVVLTVTTDGDGVATATYIVTVAN